MDQSANNILVNVSGTASIPSTLVSEGIGNQEQRNDPSEEVQRQRDQEGQMAATPGKDSSFFLPENVVSVLVGLIEKFSLTKEQFLAIYEEYERIKYLKSSGSKAPNIQQQLQVVQEASTLTPSSVPVDGSSSEMMETGEQELQDEVSKLQSVVQSAIENYHCSPIMTPKRSMNLPDDPLPSTFARELLQRDQTLVAQAIRKYLHQYSIPQREVVEKTAINQSHLSQHFTRGVPIKPAKRIKLYHWFEQDQLQRTGKLLTADGSLNAVLESPKVEGYRRRPRWRWSPVATQILSEAFKKNRFPTREQRMELSRICNEAEAAMNNGEPTQGPAGDTEGITEQRINTWFTNRRKGIVTDSPGGSETFGLVTPTTPSKTNLQKSESNTPTISIPVSLTAGSSGTNSSESVSLTTPLTLSPSQLQSLINQLQIQTPMLSQNLSQILVGHLPQSLTLQSSQSGASINLEAIIKQVGEVSEAVANETEEEGAHDGSMGVEGDEEIISHSVDPSAINSRQN